MDIEREALHGLLSLTKLLNKNENEYPNVNYSSDYINSRSTSDTAAKLALEAKLKDKYLNNEINYQGITVQDGKYKESDFLKMIENFKHDILIKPKYALRILRDSIKLLETMPNITQCNLNKSNTVLDGFIVVGDLHGSLKDLSYIIDRFGIPGRRYRYIFNGDFVDRGPHQIEVVLTILYAFLLHPSKVFINRG
jgi:disulfide oxidoreductase YuzD